uniref:Uncharacterized protein n=1 Tax=Aureoumbra lagunensis TaxID=44058 RepID=A0A7S3K3K4_9STRA|mmetsp:Transcript_4070/g.5713  ORF Transcript_4070/g.5713 Transcript_4070/m.5713 type:complete len:236 (-) Transcript_4070:131-838(-)
MPSLEKKKEKKTRLLVDNDCVLIEGRRWIVKEMPAHLQLKDFENKEIKKQEDDTWKLKATIPLAPYENAPLCPGILLRKVNSSSELPAMRIDVLPPPSPQTNRRDITSEAPSITNTIAKPFRPNGASSAPHYPPRPKLKKIPYPICLFLPSDFISSLPHASSDDNYDEEADKADTAQQAKKRRRSSSNDDADFDTTTQNNVDDASSKKKRPRGKEVTTSSKKNHKEKKKKKHKRR